MPMKLSNGMFSSILRIPLNSKIQDFKNLLVECSKFNINKIYFLFNSNNYEIKHQIKFIENAFQIKNNDGIKFSMYFCQKMATQCETKIYDHEPTSRVVLLDNSQPNIQPCENSMIFNFQSLKIPQKRQHVVLGGTFDRLHDGHRLMFSIACILALKSISIGITTEMMLKNKILYEIIQPYMMRKDNVEEYLKACAPHLDFTFSMLVDPIGISGDDPKFDTIVLTYETRLAIEAINRKRIENNLTPLSDFVIDNLLPASNSVLGNKLSSSLFRWNENGKLLRPPKTHGNPYVIGLTGCIASGKSTISEYLSEKGALILTCDKEAHACYLPETPCYKKIIETFGSEVIDNETSDHVINRRKLGEIVFSDPSKMQILNEIVWPYLRERVFSFIKQQNNGKTKVIVLDAFGLFEAGLAQFTDEIWLCVVSENEAIRRIQYRNKYDYNKALMAYNASQCLINSVEKAKYAHRIISTQLDSSITKKIVEDICSTLIFK